MKNLFILTVLSFMLSACAYVTQRVDVKEEQNTEKATQNNVQSSNANRYDAKTMHYGPVPSGRF